MIDLLLEFLKLTKVNKRKKAKEKKIEWKQKNNQIEEKLLRK